MKALEPSSAAPSAPGPTTATPRERNRSARPFTSGTSGPTTVSRAPTSSGGAGVTVIRWPSTSAGMPGLPGVTTTSSLRASKRASACSRPPLPTTQTLTVAPGSTGGDRDELLALGADAHHPDGHPDLFGEEADVVACCTRHFLDRGDLGQVGEPSRHLL